MTANNAQTVPTAQVAQPAQTAQAAQKTQTMRMQRWVALLLLILGGAFMGLGGAEQPEAPWAMLPDDADSTRVAKLQAESSEDGSGNAAIVFFNSDKAFTPEVLGALQKKAEELGGPFIPNEDMTAGIVPVNVEFSSPTENAAAIEQLRAAAAADLPAGIESSATGPAAIKGDLAGVFSGANFMLLAVTAIIVAVLLIVTYRSPVLWIIPLFTIALADRVAAIAFTYVLDALGIVWNESTSGIVSVLVFGAGTNYALLLISRYRDELCRFEDRFQAMYAAWIPTLKTVFASGMTVVLGVACLLASAVPTTRGLGAASVVGIVVAFIFSMFVLPGILVFFGRWIFWPRRPEVGDGHKTGIWDRVGSLVVSRPVAVVGASLAVLAVACLGALGIQTGLTQSDQFVKQPESIAAAKALEEKFPNQSATPAFVATQQPEKVKEVLGDKVRPAGESGEWTLLQAQSSDVAGLRAQLEGTDALVGGTDAQLVDAEEFAAQDRAIIFPLVLGLILVALAFALRSFVAPLLMVASVLLTNIAALGVGWWISKYVFGFERFAAETPLYAFVFLVALGIDYSIFIVTRARQEALEVGTREGILRSLTATGGVITSAGILLAAVFAALGVLPLVVLAQVGIVIFVGVLCDTLLVRTVLIPAIVHILGDKFWWPAKAA